MPLLDHHMHSHHSIDAKEPVDALYQAALAAGLRCIAVTDHCDLGRQAEPDWEDRLNGSIAEIERCRQAPGDCVLLTGIELGQPLHNPALAEQILQRHPFDLVIASIHNIRENDDFFFFQDQQADPAKLLSIYFEEIYETVCWNRFDVLAHLTYPYRYLDPARTPPITDYEEPLRAIFQKLAENGRALELNTSGYARIPRGPMLPELWELRLYRACGGRLVSLGSDAHRSVNVGVGIPQGQALLREAGFQTQATFSRRVLQEIPL